jgi:hypothetical protein
MFPKLALTVVCTYLRVMAKVWRPSRTRSAMTSRCLSKGGPAAGDVAEWGGGRVVHRRSSWFAPTVPPALCETDAELMLAAMRRDFLKIPPREAYGAADGGYARPMPRPAMVSTPAVRMDPDRTDPDLLAQHPCLDGEAFSRRRVEPVSVRCRRTRRGHDAPWRPAARDQRG